MAPLARSSDRAFCRAILPRVSRTFAINIRLLKGELAEAVRAGYLLCRAADALEDSWPGNAAEIRERFAILIEAVSRANPRHAEPLAQRARARSAAPPDLELVSELPRVLRVFAELPAAHRDAVSHCVRTLGSGMCRYAARATEREPGTPYLDTEAELDDYCFVVAGCVGVMLTRLFEAAANPGDPARFERRVALAPRFGEALQLTNVLLDWPADIRRGRCFIPATWLEEFSLEPRELVELQRPGVRELAARLESRARVALATVPDYLELVPARFVRYRLFCLWPALWALASLKHARRDPEFPWGERRPRLPRTEIWRAALGSLVAAHHRTTLRRLYAAAG